jgi:hypothetical protein
MGKMPFPANPRVGALAPHSILISPLSICGGRAGSPFHSHFPIVHLWREARPVPLCHPKIPLTKPKSHDII